MSTRKEFGDWQTPMDLANRVVTLVTELYGAPACVVEPTCGLGTFLSASKAHWGEGISYQGYEVNEVYVDEARRKLEGQGVQILHRDFFGEDWAANITGLGKPRVLIIGNPPWVTNSELGQLGSTNLPTKTNFQGLRGFEARTGKSNFDIAEWMLLHLVDALPEDGAMAMLCKTMTARKVLRHLWKTDNSRQDAKLFHIDAMADFGVAVDACLFYITGRRGKERSATIYSDLTTTSASTRFGFVGGDLVSDIDAYERNRDLDGGCSSYVWRSGVKHDAAKVMEFSKGTYLVNGLDGTASFHQRPRRRTAWILQVLHPESARTAHAFGQQLQALAGELETQRSAAWGRSFLRSAHTVVLHTTGHHAIHLEEVYLQTASAPASAPDHARWRSPRRVAPAAMALAVLHQASASSAVMDHVRSSPRRSCSNRT
jgi:hypothetical protein